MLRRHLIGFVVGAVAFTAAHAIEVSHWSDWFHGSYEPWFLNSGRAALFTLAVVLVASAAVAAVTRSPRRVRGGVAVGGGAFVAMAMLLFAGPGPGTIFPIVLVAGGAALLGSSLAGASVGATIGRKASASS